MNNFFKRLPFTNTKTLTLYGLGLSWLITTNLLVIIQKVKLYFKNLFYEKIASLPNQSNKIFYNFFFSLHTPSILVVYESDLK